LRFRRYRTKRKAANSTTKMPQMIPTIKPVDDEDEAAVLVLGVSEPFESVVVEPDDLSVSLVVVLVSLVVVLVVPALVSLDEAVTPDPRHTVTS
jgi:hypothetical protein